jgi:hypothetical protein
MVAVLGTSLLGAVLLAWSGSRIREDLATDVRAPA